MVQLIKKGRKEINYQKNNGQDTIHSAEYFNSRKTDKRRFAAAFGGLHHSLYCAI